MYPKRFSYHNQPNEPTMPESMVTSTELATVSQTSFSTIQYYTSLGLLVARRRAGNKRLYSLRDSRTRLRTIARLRQAGYPLNLVRERLSHTRKG